MSVGWEDERGIDGCKDPGVRIEEFGGDNNLLRERRPGKSNVDIESEKILEKALTW